MHSFLRGPPQRGPSVVRSSIGTPVPTIIRVPSPMAPSSPACPGRLTDVGLDAPRVRPQDAHLQAVDDPEVMHEAATGDAVGRTRRAAAGGGQFDVVLGEHGGPRTGGSVDN